MNRDEAIAKLLRDEADARMELHGDDASSRPLSDDYEFVGLAGEAEFSRVYNQPLDLRRRRGGDRGIDFIVPLRFTLDVKCARKPGHLICEQGKVIADIYVLAEYIGDDDAQLIGWEWGSVLRRAPVKDFGYGIINHFIHRKDIRKMDELRARLVRFI